MPIILNQLLKMRRLTTCLRHLLLAALTMVLHVSLAFSQTSPGKKIAVKDALDKVSELFGTKFVYESSTVRNKTTTVDVVQVKNQPVEEILKTILYPNNLLFLYVDRNHYTIVPKSARGEATQPSANPTAEVSLNDTKSNIISEATAPLNIRGYVIDSTTNKALAGVTVLLKGTSTGDVTDNNGRFSVNARNASNPVLEFTMVGYEKRELSVDGKSDVSIALIAVASGLGEVVVVGYGKQSKRNVTGSIAHVDLRSVGELPTTNILQAVRGRVAGVQFTESGRPGQGGSILIRGQRSINASNSPLIILDGVFFNGSLADINPNDVESMDILKDASSAAIYGSRAANGVILITTKSGKTEKPAIRFNTYYAFNDWSYKMKLLTPERYIQKLLDYRKQNNLPSDPSQVSTYLTNSEARNYNNGITVDPWDIVSQNSTTKSYDLSVSGRSNNTFYFISGAVADEKGLVYNDNSKRISTRVNLENKTTKWLTIGLSSQYVNRNLSGVEGSLQSAYWTSPYSTIYYDDGKPKRFSVDEDQLATNPLYNALLNDNEEIYHNLFSNFYAIVNVPFLKGLSYRVNYSPNFRWEHNYSFTKQDVHLTNNNTRAGKYNREDYDWTLENIVTYARNINENHNFDLTLLYGRNHAGYESTTANGTTFPTDVYSWNNLTQAATQTITSYAQEAEGISSMARLNYRFKNRYLFTLTARKDGSSVFANANKYAFFPSASLGWVISDEKFMSKVDILNFLKLRASYGAVGNQAIQPYQSLSLTATTQYVFGDGGATSNGIYTANMGNNDLKWETTFSSNAALDFEILEGRMGGTLEYYNMTTKDLILSRSVPVMTGFTNVLVNLGETNNQGIEVTLNSTNIKSKNFEWSTNVAFSSNKNKIVHLYNSDINKDSKEDDDLSNRWFIGKPVTVFYDYIQEGIYQKADALPTGYKFGWMKMKDLNGDNKIDADDRSIIGNGQPKYRWSVNNSFRYKNFSLSLFINAMQGWMGEFNLASVGSVGAGQTTPNFPGRAANMLDAGWWTEENPSNTRPSLNYNNPLGRNYYLSRDFIRIQDASLSFEVPKSLLNKAKFSELKIFVSGRNLHSWTKWLGPDPENGTNTLTNLYPMPRSFAVGLNLNF